MYVYGCTVLPGCGEPFAGQKFYTCPLASVDQPWVASLVGVWQSLRVQGVTLSSLFSSPSAALVEALTVADDTAASARARAAEEANEDAMLRFKAQQHQRAWR